MENWQKITNKLKNIRLEKIRSLKVLGKSEEEIEFVETLSPIEVDYAIWGCNYMEYPNYTIKKSNQFVKWKNNRN